jgi:hypothetical protein
MADVVISASQVIAAGQGYTVPSAQEITVRAVRAQFNGAAAATSYVPTLQIVGDSGIVVAECPVAAPVAAGASADVSWFPGVKGAAAAATGTGIQFDVVNSGGWLDIQTPGTSSPNGDIILEAGSDIVLSSHDIAGTDRYASLELRQSDQGAEIRSYGGGGITLDADRGAQTGPVKLKLAFFGSPNLIITNLPTVSPGVTGAIWNNGGVLTVA